MMPRFKGQLNVKKTDWVFYSLSVFVGMAIVISNAGTGMAQPSQSSDRLDRYLVNIINRMDAVSGQLGAWGNIDIRQHR